MFTSCNPKFFVVRHIHYVSNCNVYVDELSEELNKCNVGCTFN